MLTMENYGRCLESAPTPEWMRAERYDYCEPFFVRNHSEFVGMVSQFFARLFK